MSDLWLATPPTATDQTSPYITLFSRLDLDVAFAGHLAQHTEHVLRQADKT